MCQRAFPYSVRWQCAGVVALRWWRTALACEGARTWIVSRDLQPAGFILLLFDGETWKREQPLRNAPLPARCRALLMHPTAVRAAARKCVARLQSQLRPSRAETAIPLADLSEPRVWIELVATDPSVQGHGVGRQLLELAEQQTRDAGRKLIGLTVSTDNTRARRVYEKAGYSMRSMSRNSCIYEKKVY